MPGPVFTNNAVGTLAGNYGAAATAITLTAGQGGRFPTVAAGEWFPVTVVDAANNLEIMRCSGRTSDTLTVVRGQENTTARSWAAGDKVEHRLTAAALVAIRDQPADPTLIPDNSLIARMLAPDSVPTVKIVDLAVTNAKLAAGAVTSDKLAPGAAGANLGYTPVRQGGAGTDGNTVNLGWSIAMQRLKLTVDASDLGWFLNYRNDGTVDTAGYRGIPQNAKDIDYILGMPDLGGNVVHGAGAHTYYTPGDATPFGVGSVVKLLNLGGSLSIVPLVGSTLVWLPSGNSGARVLAAPGSCVVEKVAPNTWWIYGLGLT